MFRSRAHCRQHQPTDWLIAQSKLHSRVVFRLQAIKIALAVIAVFVNLFLLLLLKGSGRFVRTPGMMVLTLLEIVLNGCFACGFALVMIRIEPTLYVTAPRRFWTHMYALAVVNTCTPVIHGMRNYWMLVLAIVRSLIITDPLVQRRCGRELLSVQRQVILLTVFSVLQITYSLCVLSNSFPENTVAVIRTSKLAFDSILPGIGMFVSTILITCSLHRRSQAESRLSRASYTHLRVSFFL